MEVRARAGKNVGKMNFGHNELAQLLFAHGDVKQPLPETVRVLDEIATDFLHGVAFEATRTAHYAGRQKVKYEDFEFALRRNELYLGRVREVFDKKAELQNLRKTFQEDDDGVAAAAAAEETEKVKAEGGGGGGGGGRKRGRQTKKEDDDEELGAGDSDAEASRELGITKRQRIE